MNLQARLIVGSIVAFGIIGSGIAVGLFWQWIGLTHISLTSWQFWAVIISLYGSLYIQHLIATDQGKYMSDTLAFALRMYIACITGAIMGLYFTQKAIPLWYIVLPSAIYWTSFFFLSLIAELSPIKNMLNAIQRYFTK